MKTFQKFEKLSKTFGKKLNFWKTFSRNFKELIKLSKLSVNFGF